MIRRDYIIRMIEDFMALLSRLQFLKKDQQWGTAGQELNSRFQNLAGGDLEILLNLSETELLARVISGEPTMAVREKTLILASLLKEAGDVSAGAGREDESRAAYLKGLHLLLQTVATGQPEEWPQFVPRIDAFVNALGEGLPVATRAMLMHQYERAGDFGKAEDMLFSLLSSIRADPELVKFGEDFYRRMEQLPNAVLAAGNLPRSELKSGLTQWRTQASAGRQQDDG